MRSGNDSLNSIIKKYDMSFISCFFLSYKIYIIIIFIHNGFTIYHKNIKKSLYNKFVEVSYMEELVKNFLKQNNIIITKPCVIAVSGGADSVCLLHIMINLGYQCILAHVNHHKRKESDIEEEAMRALAKELNIPFELLSYNHNNIGNFENDAHHARYQFFRDVCQKYDTNVILTAHHLDD